MKGFDENFHGASLSIADVHEITSCLLQKYHSQNNTVYTEREKETRVRALFKRNVH